MEENKKAEVNLMAAQEEEKSSIDFATIYTTLILNWKWFLLSLIICLGTAAIYLRYKTPIYQASAKLLIKDNDQNSSRRNMMQTAALGMISNSNGIDNEMEILTGKQRFADVVAEEMETPVVGKGCKPLPCPYLVSASSIDLVVALMRHKHLNEATANKSSRSRDENVLSLKLLPWQALACRSQNIIPIASHFLNF